MPDVGSPQLEGARNPFEVAAGNTTGVTSSSAFYASSYAATTAQLLVLGNGVSKPLSGFYATLGLAQAAYPAASSLADELDWAVLQKCAFAAANATTNFSFVDNTVGIGADVIIQRGVYIINRQIQVNLTSVSNGGSYTNFYGEGYPLIRQTDPTKDILVWASGAPVTFTNIISGIQFGGGRRQVSAFTANFGPASLTIRNCIFASSSDYAIYAPNAANLVVLVEDSRFLNCARMVYSECLQFIIGKNTWQVGPPDAPINDTAYIYNSGVLILDGFNGSPATDSGAPELARWIDNHGISVWINNSRFGGEGASGGIGGVWQFATPDVGGNSVQTSVVIQNSHMNCGFASAPNAGVVRFQTNVPQLLILKGNQYQASGPVVSNGGGLVPATYFGAITSAYPLRALFKAEIEPSAKFEDEISAFSFPDAFRPYIAGLGFSADVFSSGNSPAKSLTEGTDTVSVNGEFYFAALNVAANTPVAGISVLNGSVASGNIRVALLDAAGNVLIQSVAVAQAGTNAFQDILFNTGVGSGRYVIQMAGKYFIGVMLDNGTGRIRTHAAGRFGSGKSTGQVFATGFTTITPPATFTAGTAPIATLI